MCDGDEWKNGDKPMASPEDMRRFMAAKQRLLLDVVGYDHVLEAYVMEVSPSGDHVQISGGWSGMWVKTSDCQILDLLPPKYYRKDNTLTKEMLDGIYKDMKGEDDNE